MGAGRPAGLTWGACLALLVVAGCGGGGDDADPVAPDVVGRKAGLVYGQPSTQTIDGASVLVVPVLGAGDQNSLKIRGLQPDAEALVKASLVPGNLIDWIPGSTSGNGSEAVVADNPADTVNVVLARGTGNSTPFSVQKYGAEVTRHDDAPGAMVAAGWVYDRGGRTITLGDGHTVKADQAGRAYDPPIRRYMETYAVADDVKVFNVNTDDYAKSEATAFGSIPVTADYEYSTTQRQAAFVLFDKDYRQADSAQVVAVWYFTPQSTSDGKPVWEVPSMSPMLADKGNDPVSGQPFIAINATSPTAAPYTRSTEPFEMVKDTMYYVGDNEVASYVLIADMGTPDDPSDDKIIKVDGGWPNSGYQYWKNMELLGLDPRSVTDIWLTHGHTDHYGTIVEQLKMMDNADKPIGLWAAREESQGIEADQRGNRWRIAGALPASQSIIRNRVSDYYEFDKWYDFGNVQIMVIWSPGHTPGTTNMLFRVKNPEDGEFYTFGYHGGYGFNGLFTPTPGNGWLRLSFEHGFSYLQQTLDVDFVAPQHTNQFPIVEVYQALKAYNRDPANASAQLTMMDAMRSRVHDSPQINGESITSEFANQLEKRRSVVAYRASDAADRRYKSLETSGPFKPGRENGLTTRARLLDDGKIIQGFVGPQNKNPRIPLLADGIQTATDTYTNDPGGFFVQVSIAVEDGYQGFLPDGLTQFSPGMNQTITYQGGPVESVHAGEGEVLRTQRVDSLEKAQRILATIQRDRAVTISLTPSSEIVVPSDVTQTFR